MDHNLAATTVIPNLPWIIGGGMLIAMAAIAGWVFTTWLRVRNGYPLENSWGKAVYPRKNDETVERVRLLTQENAQLRAELGAIKDRLANVEQIVTDSAHSLEHEIEALRGIAN
ncbi:hypothetical protein [Sphingomonas flavalba]|uniref:hypothetical protein n=1 Tax=Sphingomonas flavalba TaxID=2559804 RepID=UPI00109DADE3|nr:hypothetical protein [Sphingomonas flavalba]